MTRAEVAGSSLPRLLLLTDRHSVPKGRTLLETVRSAVDAGVLALVVRERDLSAAERGDLADCCDEIMQAAGGVCLLADPDPRDAGGARPGALHLRGSTPLPQTRPVLLGRSAHSVADVSTAAADKVDYITISPVAVSASKPGYGPALGPNGLRTLLTAAARESPARLPPAFALGGVDHHNGGAMLDAGAFGLAVMGAVMRAERPTVVVSALQDAIQARVE